MAWWGLSNIGGSPADRVDQLFGLCTPFRPPVYGTRRVRGNGDSTIVEEVDMSLTRGGWGVDTNLAAVGSVAEDIRVTTDVGQNPQAAPGMGNVVRGSLKAVQTLAAQINS